MVREDRRIIKTILGGKNRTIEGGKLRDLKSGLRGKLKAINGEEKPCQEYLLCLEREAREPTIGAVN